MGFGASRPRTTAVRIAGDCAEASVDTRRMTQRNGVPAADALALDEVVEEASRAIAGMDPAGVFETVKGLEVAVGTGWSESGNTMDYATPAQLFADSEAFQRQLRDRTREARVVAFPALAVLDPEKAAVLFGRTIELALEKSHQVSFEANVFRGLWLSWKEHVPLGLAHRTVTFRPTGSRGSFVVQVDFKAA